MEKQRQDILSGMVSHQNQLQRMNRREMLLTRVFERCKLVSKVKLQGGLLLWKQWVQEAERSTADHDFSAQ